MPTSARAAVRWLLAQAVAFGIAIALLGVVAFALFLDEYGSGWLPVTYVFIAAAGLVVSGAVARSVRRWSLGRVATAVLGGAAVAFVASWLLAAFAGAAWVSAPLVVLFPVLIQLGFVFIGGQAGQLLDLAAIKSSFPRITAGFPAGAIVGGLVASALVAIVDRAEHLLLATAVAQVGFVVLLRVTVRRFAVEAAGLPVAAPPPPASRSRWRRLPVTGFVGLIFAYQVLSAVASQFADFLVYDRAAARYGSGEALAGFIGAYTVVMNVASIAFLVLAAGLLLGRFGLRLGLIANPAVLAVLAATMAAATAGAGAGSLGLFVVVAAGRIADVALTDGTTRTSINAAYQALPRQDRLAVQAEVEGVGVPLAIGLSGVMILVLNALPGAVISLVLATLLTSVLWTWVAWRVHRGYPGALADALNRRWLDRRDEPLGGVDEDAAARRLLLAPSGFDVRLALDALDALDASRAAVDVELERLTADPRPAVRLVALGRRAGAGDASAAAELRAAITSAAASGDAEERAAAARALAGTEAVGERVVLRALLGDADAGVRDEALAAVGPDDGDLVELVIGALADLRTTEAATAALARLGSAVAPVAAARLAETAVPAPPAVTRLVRALRAVAPTELEPILRPHLRHPDRELGGAVLAALARGSPAEAELAEDVRDVLAADVRLGARLLAAKAALLRRDGDRAAVLVRAVDDELELVRRRIASALAVVYGADRLGPALRGMASPDRQLRAVAVEAVELAISRADAGLVLPILRADLDAAEQTRLLGATLPAEPAAGWLADLADDPDDEWRSPWLRECAAYAAGRTKS